MAKKKFESYMYETARLEGGLFVRDLLEKIMIGAGTYQNAKDYGIVSSIFTDAAALAWQDAQNYRSIYERNKANAVDNSRALRSYLNNIIGGVLGYLTIGAKQNMEESGRGYSVYVTEAGDTPFLFSSEDLDTPLEAFAVRGSGRRKLSPFSHMQEYLNASPKHDWGIVSNGSQIRLLRDSASLSRPAWLEFDLDKIFEEGRFPDFCAMWRIFHVSRAQKSDGKCIWERWRSEGLESGTRVKEGLRIGVREAIEKLGSGFLKNEKNRELRQALAQGKLSAGDYYAQILRLVYRMIFIFTLEERGILHTPDASLYSKNIYQEGYSMRRLRERSLRSDETGEETDLWVAAEIVFDALAEGCPPLGLPALGGLFSREETPDINGISLDNRSLLSALKSLRWSSWNGMRSPVDYKNMDSEEMGSIYEGLLEYIPKADTFKGEFKLEGDDNAGNERKDSGSYYTPTSLVSEIIDSTLVPVIEDKLQNAPDPEKALLSISVLDPACGSGHFLVAAARKLAEKLAAIRAAESLPTQEQYRAAMRDVISHCIYGVDINPLALELCKSVLWLEGFDSRRPLSFLDAHLVCGNSLLGIIDPEMPLKGIPNEAYKPLTGDNKELCQKLAAANRRGLDDLKRGNKQTSLFEDPKETDFRDQRRKIEAMPDGTLEEIEEKARVYSELEAPEDVAVLYMAGFIAQKNDEETSIPTSRDIYSLLNGGEPERIKNVLDYSKELCKSRGVLNWPAKFPLVMSRGGFDCVVGNPPWDKIKLLEKEWFAQRVPLLAKAQTKAIREKMIQMLAKGTLTKNHLEAALTPETEKKLYEDFMAACHDAESLNLFAHTNSSELPGRYPLTGVGDVNLYALFAETTLYVLSKKGRAGIIVPTGIATDDSTKMFFSKLVTDERVGRMISFENRNKIFPIDSRINFTLLIMAHEKEPEYAFFLTDVKQKNEKERFVKLSREDLLQINPNTLTVPVLRSQKDAELAKKIYKKVPVLINERDKDHGNPWGISFKTIFHMSNDSNLFKSERGADDLPLYEGKMIHQFDSRWATFDKTDKPDEPRNVLVAEKADPKYETVPRYWVGRRHVLAKIADAPNSLCTAFASEDMDSMRTSLAIWLCVCGYVQPGPDAGITLTETFGEAFAGLEGNIKWDNECAKKDYKNCSPLTDKEAYGLIGLELDEWVYKLMESRSPDWLMGWRNIARATDERTVIASFFPQAGIGNSINLMIPPRNIDRKFLALMGCLSSLVLDYIARTKLGGTNANQFIFKQLPVLAPQAYSSEDMEFIAPSVTELVYTAESLRPWAEDMGYSGDPFIFDEERRATLRSELDAYYADLYGLTREDLLFILDPADVVGPDYPTLTFSGLKANEIRAFGEYRTKRLVLEAWDRIIKK
jgi:hypothetical protein